MVTKGIKKGRKKSQKRPEPSPQKPLTPFGKSLDMENLVPPLEKLNLRLSSPRLRSETTRRSYLETALKFVNYLSKLDGVTADDFRHYFLWRRKLNISERTLRKEFYHLMKLAHANGWPWDFEKEDVPVSYQPAYQPTTEIQVLMQLIKCHQLYTRDEKFYLAVATTWGCRRQDMADITTRHLAEDIISLPLAKNHPPKKHLIPPVLKPLFRGYKPRLHDVSALSHLFHRICAKAKYKRQRRENFHSIRRIVNTEIRRVLVKNDLDEGLQADYMGWSPEKKGRAFHGSAMAGIYDHKEVSLQDPFYYDTQVYPVHPFLYLWKGVTADGPRT